MCLIFIFLGSYKICSTNIFCFGAKNILTSNRNIFLNTSTTSYVSLLSKNKIKWHLLNCLISYSHTYCTFPLKNAKEIFWTTITINISIWYVLLFLLGNIVLYRVSSIVGVYWFLFAWIWMPRWVFLS